MAKHEGKNGTVYVAGNVVAEVTDFSITETTDTINAYAMGDTNRTRKTTLKDATGSISCYWDPSDTNGQNALTNGAEVALELGPIGSDSGDTVKELTAFITNVQTQASAEGWVTASFNFELATGTVTTRAVTS